MRSYRLVTMFKIIIFVIFVCALFYNNIPLVKADTLVGGPIFSDTIWTKSKSPYVVTANIDVQPGITLTIEPGVEVKFQTGLNIQVNGYLIVNGSVTDPVIFTSIKAISEKKPGDWGIIEFTPTSPATVFGVSGNYISGSILKNCVVEFGGLASDKTKGAVTIGNQIIDDCTVRDNEGVGVYVYNSGKVTNSTIENNSSNGIYSISGNIENNIIRKNSSTSGHITGVGIYASESVIKNNYIAENSGKGKSINGVGIYGQNSIIDNNHVEKNVAIIYTDDSTYYSILGTGISASDSIVENNTINGNRSYGSDILGAGLYIYKGKANSNNVIANIADTTDQEISWYIYYPQVEGGGIHASGDAEITRNYVKGNHILGPGRFYGGGIFAESGMITENHITENRVLAFKDNVWDLGEVYGGGIYIDSFTESVFQNNTVTYNEVSNLTNVPERIYGSGVFIYGIAPFYRYPNSNNIIMGNIGTGSVPIGGLTLDIRTAGYEVHDSSFLENYPYDVVLLSDQDINGTNNYWGTTDSVDILAQVYDWYDDSDLGKFIYAPYLQTPSIASPIFPPTNISISSTSNNVLLTWSPIPSFTTGWGYKIYYGLFPYPPFSGTGLIEGNSPIDVGNRTSFTLSNLVENRIYYFFVTAYDNLGHESWYSKGIRYSTYNMIFLPITVK